MILLNSLPLFKTFLHPVSLGKHARDLLTRCVAAFALHTGRMSASQAAEIVKTQPRHRAQITRFLARHYLTQIPLLAPLRNQLLAGESVSGRYVFIVDQTLSSQQGEKTQNTYSTGNRKRRPRKGRRYSTCKHTRKQCHCFVMGLLLTPSGRRIPFRRCYYTKEYCQAQGRPYRKQTELAVEMIRELPTPAKAKVVVLGDTAFDAQVIRNACAERSFTWIVPMNSQRVLAGPKPRPKVSTLAKNLTAGQFQTVRLVAGRGALAALRRVSTHRIGSKAKPRVYYTYSESREVHSVGMVQLVFSTREQPRIGRSPVVQKILMTNDQSLSCQQVVELYDLRWQIELFFKELKSTLGFDQYRFRSFAKVEGWLELVLVTFVYLEWVRAYHLRRTDLSREDADRWRCQRTHGLCVAVRRQTEWSDMECVSKALQTPGGIRRLQRLLDAATQKEYRLAW